MLLSIWGHLSRRRRLQLAFLLLVMLASGLAELVSLGTVLPFLAVLTNPGHLWQQPLIKELALRLGYSQAQQLLLPSTLAFAFAAVIAAAIRILNLWLNGRLAAAVGSDLSCEAYQRTLYQPYTVHVQRNSSEVITAIITQTNITVAGLNSLLQLITSAVVAVALLTGLILIDAKVALSAAALFGSAYGVLAITASRELRRNGQKIAETSTQQLKALQEGLGAIRDVLLDGSQSAYLEIYRQADRPQRKFKAKNVFLGIYPRFALEGMGMVAIALLGWLLVLQQGSGASVIPLLGALALGAQRLLPTLQQIYVAWAALKGYGAAIKSVLLMLDQPLPPEIFAIKPLKLREKISLEGVCFRYGPDQVNVLDGLNLDISRGERIGLIGTTGSGKSTTTDLVMGLLAPTAGRVFVDGTDIYDPTYPERLSSWRATIAHVPQSIFLADGSIAENIAIGVPMHKIDMARVRLASKQAQIDDYIESCPEKYNSLVGERGIRLSGGQRQRIGIARALYRQASLIILDEATSALDTSTENAVMEAVEGLDRNLTLVIIAHRLSTVQRCDRVIRLVRGSVSADGPPRLVLPNIT